VQKSRGFEWSYRDLLTALVVVYMAMAALALVAATKASSQVVPPGNVMFQLTWDMRREADADLWVKAPGDQPVGYSHPAGRHCNLLRDDLGRPIDPESRNTELTVCRGTPDGEWVANAALYADRDHVLPVSAVITAFVGDAQGTHEIARREVMLTREGDEETAFRFTLSHGRLVAGSVNHLPMVLWGGGQGS
jgi:hypothetical protein